MSDVHDSIVIGAGAAGLAAALTLHEAGRDVVVLEARDRIGGRAHSVSLSDGAAVERGAQMVHGPTVATWDFIVRFGLKTHGLPSSWTGSAPTFREGRWLPTDDPINDEAYQRLDEVLGAVPSDTVSLRQALATGGLSGARLGAAEAMLSLSAPVPPEELSARNAAHMWHIHDSSRDPISGVSRPGNPNFQFIDGYRTLWSEMSRSIEDLIHLRTPVASIDWSPQGVVVRGPQSDFKARSVILTLPVGVLQQGGLEFRPPLPGRKLDSIRSIRSGGIIKVLAEFRRRWWQDTVGPVPFFRNGPPSPFRTFADLFWNRPGPPALGTSIGHPHVRDVTGDTDRVRSLFFGALGEMFPETDLETELVSLQVADWASDPWAMGTQSCVPVAGHQLRADLAAPTPPLFWAGEATHTRGLAACVHGALETGRRAALEALHTLQPLLSNDPQSRLDWWQYSPAIR